jgi:serine O-acetyltransferase
MIRTLLLFIGQLLFLPHVLVFLVSNSKELLVADLYARSTIKKNTVVQCYDLSRQLLINKYFRTLFYHRTRGFICNLLRIFYPKENSFIIDYTTQIGGGLQLAHPYSTILNAERIGANVYVNHLVTVGEKNGKRPTIGNNVELHAACIVIGEITLGDHCVVGAGAVVVKDVPAGAVVVGNPARIITSNL